MKTYFLCPWCRQPVLSLPLPGNFSPIWQCHTHGDFAAPEPEIIEVAVEYKEKAEWES